MPLTKYRPRKPAYQARKRPTYTRYKPTRKYVSKKRVPSKLNKPYTKINRMLVPERVFTTLRYSEVLTLTCPVVGALTPYIFQTSIFDPDFSGGGHQPLWRDQLATLYNRYRVFGMKYKVVWKNTQINQLSVAYVKHSDNSTTETNFNTLSERREGRAVALDSANGRCNYSSGYLSIPKAYGISKKEFYDDDGFISVIGASPTKMAYLHLYLMSLLANAVFNVFVTIDYYVEFTDRVDIAGS